MDKKKKRILCSIIFLEFEKSSSSLLAAQGDMTASSLKARVKFNILILTIKIRMAGGPILG
jgi:hypothetical protein